MAEINYRIRLLQLLATNMTTYTPATTAEENNIEETLRSEVI
jgi:hypothetical protein